MGEEQHPEEFQWREGGDGQRALWGTRVGGGESGRWEGNTVAATESLAALGDPSANIETGAPNHGHLFGLLVVRRLLLLSGIAAAQPAPVVLVGLRNHRGSGALASHRRAQGNQLRLPRLLA